MKTLQNIELSKSKLDPIIKILQGEINKGVRLILLSGELGSGKTYLTQKLIRHFIPTTIVQSPTFVIEKVYTSKSDKYKFKYLHHLDLYRLKYYSEFIDLGIPDLMRNMEHLFIIEWPELIENKTNSWIKIDISNISNGKKRKYTISRKS